MHLPFKSLGSKNCSVDGAAPPGTAPQNLGQPARHARNLAEHRQKDLTKTKKKMLGM